MDERDWQLLDKQMRNLTLLPRKKQTYDINLGGRISRGDPRR